MESDINRCLFLRFVEEPQFNQISEIETELLKQCKEEFDNNFVNKQGILQIKFDQEIQDPEEHAISKLFSFDNHIDGFWQNLETWLNTETLNKIACKVIE